LLRKSQPKEDQEDQEDEDEEDQDMNDNDTSEHEIHRRRTGLIFLSKSQLSCLNKMERNLAEMRKTIQKLIKIREQERERERECERKWNGDRLGDVRRWRE